MTWREVRDMGQTPTENDWTKAEFVWQRRQETKCKYVQKLIDEVRITKASVVPISWLRAELDKCVEVGHETIRIAAAPDGTIFIEGQADVADFDEAPPGATGDPPGWNNDWPEINLP